MSTDYRIDFCGIENDFFESFTKESVFFKMATINPSEHIKQIAGECKLDEIIKFINDQVCLKTNNEYHVNMDDVYIDECNNMVNFRISNVDETIVVEIGIGIGMDKIYEMGANVTYLEGKGVDGDNGIVKLGKYILNFIPMVKVFHIMFRKGLFEQ